MNRTKSIVVLTGAGISAESGIKTFRTDDGVWEEHKIEDVATPEAFERDPWLVQTFYNQRRRPLLDHQVQANPAHHALAKLEREFDGHLLLVTQNIDNLHELGGSKHVLHMHGDVLKMRCKVTSKVYDCYHDIDVVDLCDCCGKPNHLRPHIVWFGEMPLYMDEISSAISTCDLFISIGTSGNVYPAAGFAEMAQQSGAATLEINLEKSLVANNFDQGIYGKAGEVLPIWVNNFLAERRP
jgi:NAD-dependent deacetylase